MMTLGSGIDGDGAAEGDMGPGFVALVPVDMAEVSRSFTELGGDN